MNVSVPSEFVAFVDQLVSGGAYPTPDAVVGDALALMRDRRAKLDELKASLREAQDQIARGECGPFDVEEILAAGRQSLAGSQAS
jgi:putative addiction module CopG family antidote